MSTIRVKTALSDIQVADLKQRVIAGESKTKIAKAFHISRETLYKYLRQ